MDGASTAPRHDHIAHFGLLLLPSEAVAFGQLEYLEVSGGALVVRLAPL